MLIPLDELTKEYNVALKGVLHLGAHHGQEAEDYATHNAKEVLWVEANADVMDTLNTNLSKYQNQKSYNFLISDEDGKSYTFNITNNEQSSSILKLGTHSVKHPTVVNVESREMIGKRLDTFIAEEKIDLSDFNFLNIDLQGAELTALKSLGNHVQQFDYIYTEININHLYVDCPLLSEIDSFLHEHGFIRKATRLFKGEKGWGDALYVKEKVSHKAYYKLYLEAKAMETKQRTKDKLRQLKHAVIKPKTPTK